MWDSVSVVIPTLNAGAMMDDLLVRLEAQTVRPREIIVVDSSSDDSTVEVARGHALVRVVEIPRADFDHGGTRNKGFNEAIGDFVLFVTQDAVPVNELMIEKLLQPFEDEKVAIVSGRQLPKQDARPFEQLVREFNYPEESNKRTKEDIERLGIKAFFSSDVCCMYRRTAIEKIGGIPAPCSTNEDMLAAARCLRSGMSVCYASDAMVFHSHNFTICQQFKRNKAIGKFLSVYSEELNVPSEIGEGGKLVKHVIAALLGEGRVAEVFMFLGDCLARFLGNRCGRR